MADDAGTGTERGRGRAQRRTRGRSGHGGRRRSAALAVALLAVGAGVWAARDAGPRSAAPAPSPRVVVLPSPTPTVAPIAREPRSRFVDALPATVLDHALTAVAEEPVLLGAGALEAVRLEYADGAGGTVTVLAGQWPTPEDAADVLAWLTADDPPPDDGGPATGRVLVDGDVAGRWVAAAAEGGATTVTWTNATVVLRATAPADTVRDVHAAFPW